MQTITADEAESRAVKELERLKLPVGRYAKLEDKPSSVNGHGGRRGRGKSSHRGQGKRSGKHKGGK